MPVASVIIPAYNQARFLGDALRSVLAQTLPDFEVIVVDDGSTDDTAQVVRAATDPRIRYIYQENRGLSAARNAGVREARGAYLSYLDSDDLFLPRKLELLVGEIASAPGTGFAAGQAIPVDAAGQPTGKIFDEPIPDDPARLLLGNPLHVGSVLVRRDWQERAGFFDETLNPYADWDMWLRLARVGCPMRYVAEPVSLYRFHGQQMTRNRSQMTAASFAMLDKTFADPTLPPGWLALKDAAYSRANLRAAAQAYLNCDYDAGIAHLSRAVELEPGLAANGGARLERHLSAWIELPKFDDPISFMEEVYAHLPPELDALSARRDLALGRVGMGVAFEAYARGEYRAARRAAMRAVRHDPSWLGERGAVSVLVHSHLRDILRMGQERSE